MLNFIKKSWNFDKFCIIFFSKIKFKPGFCYHVLRMQIPFLLTKDESINDTTGCHVTLNRFSSQAKT